MGKSGEKMFIGQFEHSLDEKGRVAIPAKFRRELKEGAIVSKGLDGCLFLFSKTKFTTMAQSISSLPISKSSARLYSRLMLASAVEAEFDNQGRILIPASLRRFSSLTKTAIITGLYDRIEIWSKSNWEKESAKADKKAEEIVEELSELGV